MAQNLYFEMHVQWAREIWKRMAPHGALVTLHVSA